MVLLYDEVVEHLGRVELKSTAEIINREFPLFPRKLSALCDRRPHS